MPPIPVKYSSKAKLYKREFNCEFRVTPEDELFCVLCMSNVTCEKRQQVERHRATMKHISARGAIKDQNKKVTLTQQLLPVVSKDFMAELVKTFLAADIPLHKLRNPHVSQLFENLGEKMPSETVCRDYVKTLANNEQDHLKYLLEDKCIFIVIDESEVDKTKFINVIVGDIDVLEKTYLIECCVTETVNQNIICMKIDDFLHKLGIARGNFLRLFSDAVSYPRLFHVTCLAHMLHNRAEKVRGAFTDVDNLVARVKATTIKNKSRQAKFRHIGSSPEPVVTRWGTWLKAADYYADNLIETKKIVNEFEGNGILVKRAKEAVNDAGITASLLKIKWDYSQIPKIIQKKIISEIHHY